MTRVLTTIHLCVLGLWAGALLMAGGAAAVIFPTVKDLQAQVPALSTYTGEHWRLVGGRVANKIFLIADIAQLILAGKALLTLAMLGLRRAPAIRAGRVAIVWIAGLGASLMLLSYHLLVLQPRMGANLRKYWDAAGAGQNVQAQEFRLAFDADHPTASRVLITLAVLVVITLIAAVWQNTRQGSEAGRS
jgi:hypothetical protein